nr:MAG: GAF domain-containing protein [Leptolyngbya sp. IPPAS B-1204]
MRHMSKGYCISVGITALLYFLVAKLVFSSLQLGIEPSPVWPPAGIALFVLLQQGRWVWPGVALGVLLVGSWLGVSGWLALGSAIGATIEAVLGTTLLRWNGFCDSLERLRDVLSFLVLAVLIPPILNATISTGTAVSFGHLSQQLAIPTWWTYWLSDSTSILVFTPFLLVLQPQQLRFRKPELFALRFSAQWLERLLCLSLLAGTSWLVFHSRLPEILVNYPIEYLPFPFVIWAALRLGQPTGIMASFLLAVIAISGTIAGNGPFVTMANTLLVRANLLSRTEANHQMVLLLQTFLGVITTTGLLLAAVTTERQRVERLLRHSQASLAKAQHLARLGNWDFDFQQQRWTWSDELYRLLGFTIASVVPSQQAFLAAVHPEDRPRVEQAITRALEQRIPYRMDYRLQLPDHTERIIEEQVVIGPHTATGTVLDITERKLTEAKLRLNAERNRLLSEMALRIRQSLDLDQILNTIVQEVRQVLQADRVFICRFDAEGNGWVVAESVLPEWNSALSMTSDASVYPEIQAIFAERHLCIVNDTSQQERTPFIRQYHDRYQVKAGMGVAITSDPEAIEHCRLFGLLIVHQCSHPREWQPLEIELMEQLATQITIAIQQGQLYQQVQQLNSNLEQQVAERTLQLQKNLEKLEDMNELQDVFLHAIAHDLRTTIMGTLMVLKNFQQHPGDEISIPRSLLERMTQSGETQLCKLNALLEAYTNRTEGVVLQPEPMQVQELLQTVATDLKPLLERNQATLELAVDQLPPVMADGEQLRRVFQQLLLNAVKHNLPGVHITVEVKPEPQWLRFIVADNGKGISQSQRERLFDLKLGAGPDRQLTGIGVGLCLCQQIITAHGGKIGVESEVGHGSRFWFTLPR